MYVTRAYNACLSNLCDYANAARSEHDTYYKDLFEPTLRF